MPLGGKWVKLNKSQSMPNKFTFLNKNSLHTACREFTKLIILLLHLESLFARPAQHKRL